jgi:hypothetical protein
VVLRAGREAFFLTRLVAIESTLGRAVLGGSDRESSEYSRLSVATLKILFRLLVSFSDCFAKFVVNVRLRLDLIVPHIF